MVKLGDIKPYEKNAKKHNEDQIQLIVGSLKKNDYYNPIGIDSKNEIVVGHGRFEAFKRFKSDDELIEVVDFSYLNENQIRALRIKDNKVVSDIYDQDKLNAEIESILNSYDGDLSELEMDLSVFGLQDYSLDYSSLEDENNDKLEEMNLEVRKAIQIEFELQDYEQARNIIKEIRQSGIYVGGLILELLKNKNENNRA